MEPSEILVDPQNLEYEVMEQISPTMKSMTANIVEFQEGMVRCYQGTSADDLEDFKNLRDLIVSDAIVYFDVVIPITQQVFQDIYNTFHTMTCLDTFEEFMENLDLVIEDVQRMQNNVLAAKELHHGVYIKAKERSLLAESLLTTLVYRSEEANKEFQRLKEERELREKQQKDSFKFVLGFLGIVDIDDVKSPWTMAILKFLYSAFSGVGIIEEKRRAYQENQSKSKEVLYVRACDLI